MLIIANNLPVITPKEPPATKIALCESFPLEQLRVTFAPFICIHAFPNDKKIKAIYLPEILKPNNKSATINKNVPTIPKLIFFFLSLIYPIKDCGTKAKAS